MPKRILLRPTLTPSWSKLTQSFPGEEQQVRHLHQVRRGHQGREVDQEREAGTG